MKTDSHHTIVDPSSQTLALRFTAEGLIGFALKGGECKDRLVLSLDLAHIAHDWADVLERTPLLSEHAGAMRGVYPSSHYVLIPTAMSGEEDEHWWRLTAPIHMQRDSYYHESVSLGVGQPIVATGWSREAQSFLARSFVDAHFVPSIVAFARAVIRESAVQSRPVLGIEIAADGIDLVQAYAGRLIRANHYQSPRSRQTKHHLYHILYFLSKSYFDTPEGLPREQSVVALSDALVGTDPFVSDLVEALRRQLVVADFAVTDLSMYWTMSL